MDVLRQLAIHYYDAKAGGPLGCLRSMRQEDIQQVQHKFITTSQEQQEYMRLREAVEKMMYRSFLRKGGKPKQSFAYYFCVGKKEILKRYYTNPASIAIPISYFDPSVISFTYCDSFLTYSRTDNHPTRRKLYTVDEIGKVIDDYGVDFDEDDYMALIEMQLWDTTPLYNFCRDNGLVD